MVMVTLPPALSAASMALAEMTALSVVASKPVSVMTTPLVTASAASLMVTS